MLMHNALGEARERGRQLRADAAAERLRPPAGRRWFAETLRHVADRLDRVLVVIPLNSSHR
ncbi:MAG: hypothetical protein ACXVRI_08945 [Gaiellaceae bacterium]